MKEESDTREEGVGDDLQCEEQKMGDDLQCDVQKIIYEIKSR